MKYLVVIGVIAVVLWLMFGRRPRIRAERTKAKAQPSLEGMVQCAHCGVHLPRSEALRADGHSYCSAAHRDAGPRADA
ncbi:MAG: hypothetical protein MUC32_03090 [Burkholderiaceae bacterium]|jgi:uncharacterized protein|nr:hypothetical protein [Burkholderiaceae bacterium]